MCSNASSSSTTRIMGTSVKCPALRAAPNRKDNAANAEMFKTEHRWGNARACRSLAYRRSPVAGEAMSNTDTPLHGCRVLIAEDEYFLANDLERALRERGAHVVGPCAELTKPSFRRREITLTRLSSISTCRVKGPFQLPML